MNVPFKANTRITMPGIANAIGIRVGVGKASINWIPQTLVVEDATPTNVNMTFTSVRTIDSGDFTIAGFTILSGSWSGNIYTLVLSVPVIPSDTLTVVYNGESYPVTNNTALGILFGDELFYLGGEIFIDSGNYYIQDKSGNGRHFLITDYDFDSTLTKGFPYKSAATISAPAADATLIAEDINNYLYDSGGTPNAIPVVSLFQDIDYEHKIFCKHAAQILNDDDVEIYEPRVLEIVMYDNVKTGADLTTCQSYFGVPVEAVSDVQWVMKTGDDANHAGTKIAPFKKILWATNYYGTSGNTLYVKSGDYQEDSNFDNSGYLMHTIPLSIKQIGYNKLRSYSGSHLWLINGNITVSMSGTIIGNASNDTAVVNAFAAAVASLTIDRCKISTGLVLIEATKATVFNLTNSILSGATNRQINLGNGNATITGCFSADNKALIIDASTSVKTRTIQYNKFLVLSVGVNFSQVLDISFNRISNGLSVTGATGIVANTSSLLIGFNKIISASTVTPITVIENHYNTTIKNNELRAVTDAIVTIAQQTTLMIQNNFVIAGSGQGSIGCLISTNLSKSVTIENNIVVNEASAPPIYIGDETTTAAYNSYSGIIRKNRVYSNGILSHGPVVYNQIGVSYWWNFIEAHGFGMAVKSIGGDLSSSGIHYNISKNCTNGISGKGGDGQMICNNTIINAGDIGIYLSDNPEGATHGTVNTTVKNNIVHSVKYCVMYDAGSVTGNEFDYNIYYSTYAKPFNVAGVEKTWAEWQALGNDAHSLFLTAGQFAGLFTDYDNDDFSLNAGSVAIGTGVDLGASYDDGLDASTDWGSDTELPSIVNKQQGISWDIGAYIH